MTARRKMGAGRSGLLGMAAGLLLVTLGGCDNNSPNLATGKSIVVDQYDATATVTYTWQVQYAESFDQARTIRRETFESTSLLNHNGMEPEGAVTGPDDQGLWWPALPPRPTVDDLESRLRQRERRTDPELLKSVDYAITFDQQGQTMTLAANQQVYRQATKAQAAGQALELTYGPGNQSIAQAQPTGRE